MESNYAKYIREREGLSIIEHEFGFVTYSINKNICFIHDLFIVPESRRLGLASHICNQVVKNAIEKNCDILKGSVCPQAENATEALKFQLDYGMQLESSNLYTIVLSKRI